MSTLAVLRSQCGERDEARRLAQEALEVAESRGFGGGKVWSQLALARICLHDENPAAGDEAAAWLTSAQRSIDLTGAFLRLPDLLELRAELAGQRGDAAAREAALREALQVFQEWGATPHVERIERELAS